MIILPHLYVRKNVLFELGIQRVNPFTPESDQSQISPPAPPEILHHTVRRTWLFIAYSDDKWSYYKFSLSHLCIFSLKGWENGLFELRSECHFFSVPQEAVSLRWKRIFFLVNVSSFFSSVYFYFRHNWYCEPYSILFPNQTSKPTVSTVYYVNDDK